MSDTGHHDDSDIEYEIGSDNVFADLGFENPDEELTKAHLAYEIGQAIDSRGLTQTAAAELLGTTQPKISRLVRGGTEGFSVERLFKFLNALDRDVRIIVQPKPKSRTHGITMVRVQPAPALRVAERAAHHGRAAADKRAGASRPRMRRPGP